MDGVAMTHGQSGDSENVSHEARLLDLNWKHNYTTNGGIRKTFRKIVNESRLWCRVRAMQIHSKKVEICAWVIHTIELLMSWASEAPPKTC